MERLKKSDISKIALVFIILTVQRLFFGFKYFPNTDDWFLYLEKNVMGFVDRGPDLSTRPFAGIFDRYVISPLSDNLIFAEIILMIMLVLSAWFFCRAFYKNGFLSNTIFILCMTLFPVSFEGLYWLAAATRIIPSLFFISLCAFCFTNYIHSKKTVFLIIYILSGIFSVSFYEIFIPVYITLIIVLAVKNKSGYKLIIFPIVFSACMALYYMKNKLDPAISNRLTFVDCKDFLVHGVYTVKQYGFTLKQGILLIYHSFLNGAQCFLKNPFGSILIIASSVGLALISTPRNDKKNISNVVITVILILSGISLNFVIGFVRVPFRLFVPMMLGVALIIEYFSSLIFRGVLYKVLVFLVSVSFSICNTGSLSLYKYTAEKDFIFAQALANTESVYDTQTCTYIINAPQYWYEDNVHLYEYVKANSENYAVITAQVRFISDNYNINNIMTLHENNTVGLMGSNITTLYYDNGKLRPCRLLKSGNDFLVICDGANVGKILTVDNKMYYVSK